MGFLPGTLSVRRLGAGIAGLALLAGAWVVAPVLAAPLAGVDEYPRVVVLARHDVPFDALGAGAVAAQLGAPVIITSPTALSDTARLAIVAADPEVILVAGGPVAISEEVAAQAAAACDPTCTIDRRGGEDRDATAALLAQVTQDYDVGGPVVTGDKQVVGDVHLGGTLHADDITVQSGQRVQRLNADRVDGVHASQLLQFPLVIADRGDPRLSSTESDAVATERGEYLNVRTDDFVDTPLDVDVWIDLPTPVTIGQRPMALTRVEFCHRTFTTEAAVVEVEVVTAGAVRTATEWTPAIDLPYPHTASVPHCIDLQAPTIEVDGVARVRVRIRESDSGTGNDIHVHGLIATWQPS